jgi:hypothetical protein
MTHIIIKDTNSDKVVGRLCIERGVSANIIASTEEASAALCKVAQAMDVNDVFLFCFHEENPPTEDGWRLTDVRVYVKQT